MTRYAALLRGVNVGGRKVGMPELREVAEQLGYAEVSTYINSGNLLLSSGRSATTIRTELERALNGRFGYPARVIVRDHSQLRSVLTANPYPEGNPSQVTVAFLAAGPDPEVADRMAGLATADEQFTIADTEIYVDFAGGLGRSKLAERLQQVVGVDLTVRNVRTVGKLVDLLDR
ncbi:DUF1697 domain-containing protein [Microlunatus panaciterrae]|uniref:Uncharacterized protein (DUF1697 family) n=1 Tax=Microlunatus panaciterrae TaxID=400768 RepID=A0ABS2RE89_9ACTN|nr:DUF1697 domain-containing protein [Microlunatus panaciterrae]MBM7797310.1 uncharacterized protein (DUF1697 family) [Microlunatus panaciterrae]